MRYDLGQRPFIVIWEATRACDLACVHCRAEACPFSDPGELTTEEGFRLIGQVASFGRPHPLFVITGGDPFKRSDLLELVSYAAGKGLPVSVAPSATPLLNRDSIRRLKEAGAVALSLSLDGARRETHDGFRQVDGVFDRTLDCWRIARELGIKVQINTTVTPPNVHDLPEILRLVRSHGAMTWSVFFLVPTGRGEALQGLTAEETEDILHFLYDVSKVVSLKTTEAPHFRRVAIQRRILEEQGVAPVPALGLGETYLPLRRRLEEIVPDFNFDAPERMRRAPLDVNAGRGFVFVSHTGEVCPSGFLPQSAGNIRKRPLSELYRDSPLFRILRSPDCLQGRCGRCEFRKVCGGSRSRAFATTGNVLAEEPWCVYQPGSFAHQREVGEMVQGTGGPIAPADKGRLRPV